jgi:phosphatidylglycerol---prolipoprotein diacylglyceryl transferase
MVCRPETSDSVLPELFSLGPLTVYTYGVLLAAAYLLGLKLAMVRARARGLDPTRMLDLGIYIIISALVGAKVLLFFVDFEHFRQNPAELLSLARSGGVFYGGLILAVTVAFWYMRRHGLPLWQTCDVFAPGIALGHAIGRLGCLAAGCCYGRPTTVPWAITFTNSAAAANVGTPLGVPLHPTQLYESGAELLILILLLATERKGRSYPGRTFWLYMLLYGISRFVIEFFRGDDRGMVFGTLSTSQFISLVIVPLSLFMLVWLARRDQSSPANPEPRSLKRAHQTG